MNITITVDVNVTFYHKLTMEKIVIDKIIKEKYKEVNSLPIRKIIYIKDKIINIVR